MTTHNINVLSYNVSWEAMSDGRFGSGTVPGSINCKGQCIKNVTELINNSIKNHGVNLIGTQETGLLENIVLPGFDKIQWKLSGVGKTSSAMIMSNNTIFRNVTPTYFKLNEPPILHIKGDVADEKRKAGKNTGIKPTEVRPYHFTVLKHNASNEDILFINIHNDHQHNIPLSLNFIEQKIDSQGINDSTGKKLYKKINKIIITGDFNANATTGLTLFGNQLIAYTLPGGTCCDGGLNGNITRGDTRDNILTYGFTSGSVTTMLTGANNKLYSDHLPVLVKLTFQTALPISTPTPTPVIKKLVYGFDFDGVIQKNMDDSKLEIYKGTGLTKTYFGKRHPNHTGPLIINDTIKQLINDLKDNNEIRVYTGRANTRDVQTFLDTQFGKNQNIILKKSSDRDTELGELEEYYDDSRQILIEILVNQYYGGKAPNKTFLVIPEENQSYLIHYEKDFKTLNLHFNRVVARKLIKDLVIIVNRKNKAGDYTPETDLINEIKNFL